MSDRIPADVFFDRRVIAWTPGPARPPAGWIPVERIEGGRFYRGEAAADHGRLDVLAAKLAASGTRFGLVLMAVGFFAVFIKQAPIHLQIVFGAPVFEEFLKFGLALLLSAWMRFFVLRLLVALAVGAGFGLLEHWVTYADEPWGLYIGRIAFHAGATGLSMASYHVLENVGDVRVRWASTLWASLLHYINNSLALVSIVPALFVPALIGPLGLLVALSVTISLYVGLVWVLLARRRMRAWAVGRVAELTAA